MRTIPSHITNLWNAGGPFIGDDAAPNAVVLADPLFFLGAKDLERGGSTGLDVEFYGNSWYGSTFLVTGRPDLGADPLYEVPNVQSIDIDRSLDQDAATCKITIGNWAQAQDPGRSDVFGTRGPLSFWRGGINDSAQRSRWNMPFPWSIDSYYADLDPGAWKFNILKPSTLLYTYQGYGGRGLSWSDAVGAGYITRTGIWLVDEVEMTAAGVVTLSCRDLAKLLIEQTVTPDLTPASRDPRGIWASPWYPLQWVYGTNYTDYTQIIEYLCSWSGFNAPSTSWSPLGNYETTGAFFPDGPVAPDIFDKRPVIDGIHAIKEAVGYCFYIDDDGLPHFESPNFWTPGNWNEVRDRVGIPDIDERLQLTQYTAKLSDAQQAIAYTVATGDPWIVNMLDPNHGQLCDQTSGVSVINAGLFMGALPTRGVWPNERFTDPADRANLVRLLCMFAFFQARQGSLSCPANPAIQLNDQVRIWEETTAESYIHYVRGVSTHQDLQTGEYTMTLTTNWLGDYPGFWVANESPAGLIVEDVRSGIGYAVFLPSY